MEGISYKEFMELSDKQKTEFMKKKIDGLRISDTEEQKERILNDAMVFINGCFWKW